jgi:osmotically-inducible protein OsmY
MEEYMSRKHHRRDHYGWQGSAQRPWEHERAEWQNRGSMQRQQYDNIGRDRYGSNTGEGGGYGSRDRGRGDYDSRPDWPGQQENRRYRSQGYGGDSGMGRYQGERSGGYGQNYGSPEARQGVREEYGRASESRGYEGRGRDADTWGERESEFESPPRSERDFEAGRWHREEDRRGRGRQDQDYDDQSGDRTYGSQGSGFRSHRGSAQPGYPWGGEYDYGRNESAQHFGRGNYGSRSYGSQTSSGYGSAAQNDFSGKGPKGYRRADERIQEEINEELTRHSDIDASEIEVKVSNGEVTLTGTVDHRDAKRMAEDCAERVSGVTDVQNQIRVQKTVGAAREEDGSSGARGKMGRSGSSASSTGSSSSEGSKTQHRTGAGIGS